MGTRWAVGAASRQSALKLPHHTLNREAAALEIKDAVIEDQRLAMVATL
jgi:hypothetical protein